MIRTPGFVTSLSLSLAALGCGSGSASLSTETGASVSAQGAESDGAAEDAAADTHASSAAAAKSDVTGGAKEEEAPEPAGADTAREMLRGAEGPLNPLGVALVVGQRGSDLPWTLIVANRGAVNVTLAGDVRLLELEVQKPAPAEPEASESKKPKPTKIEKPALCRFSAGERPQKVDATLSVTLPPDSMALYRFDPRLICDEEILVPGATVTPRFGWEPKTKTVWKAGKKEEVLLPQEAPFVAVGAGEGGPEPLKQLVGEPFTLDSSYAPPEEPEKIDSKEPPPLALSVRPLGSASDARTETVTVEIKNPASVGRYLFLRRELITYEVVGPAGNTSCSSYPDQRAPSRQGFEFLSPGRTLSLTSRLPEMCPPGTFDTSGLYRVHARLDAVERGDDYKLDAFVGSVTSKRPGILRMRGGSPPRMFVLPVQPPPR